MISKQTRARVRSKVRLMATTEPRRGRRPVNQETRPEQITEVAVRLFAEKGYQGTTIKDIMAPFGATGAAFYYYFPSKDALLQSIFDDAMTVVERELTASLDLGLGPAEALEHVIGTHARVIAERRFVSNVLLEHARELPPRLARRAVERQRAYTARIREVYERGVAQGVFLDEDPELVVNGLLGMANWSYRWFHPGRHPEPATLGELFGRLAVNAIKRGHRHEATDAA
jgi:AcrR family transcriptional regulator